MNIWKAGGKDVVSATVKNDKFEFEFKDKDWGDWGELTLSSAFTEIVSKASSKLRASRDEHSKGAGKGQP